LPPVHRNRLAGKKKKPKKLKKFTNLDNIEPEQSSQSVGLGHRPSLRVYKLTFHSWTGRTKELRAETPEDMGA
jgi:hypothetical protein